MSQALTPAALRRRLLRLARPVLPPLALSVLCRVIQLLAGIALFGLAGWAIGEIASEHVLDLFMGGDQRPGRWSVTEIVVALAALSLIKGAARYGEQFCGHLVAFKALARLRVYFYDALEPQAPAATLGRSTGDLLSRITKDVDRVEVFFAHTLAPATTALIVPLATVIAYAGLVDPLGALLLAAALLAVGLGVPLLGRRSSAAAATELRAGRGALAQHVTDSVQGVREVLAFDYADRRLEEQDQLAAPITRGLLGLGRWIAVRRGINTLIIALTLIAMFAVLTRSGLAPLGLDIGVTLATLGLGLGLTAAAFTPVLAVEDFAADLQQAYASARRLFEVTDAAPLVADVAAQPRSVPTPVQPPSVPVSEPYSVQNPALPPEAPAPTPAQPPSVPVSEPYSVQNPALAGTAAPQDSPGWRATSELSAPTVVFDHVTFAYPSPPDTPPRTTPALDQVTFTAQGGQVTALVGTSGSGKSTLAALLVRAWDPDQGTIRLVSGSSQGPSAADSPRLISGPPQGPSAADSPTRGDIRLLPLAQLRAEVGITDQRPYLFNDSIEANLRLARPDATAADIDAATHTAGLDEVLAAEPDGLATPVGEMGERLSGGQRQRVALARTLLAAPAVLVLDEATSQLDADTERRVLENLRSTAQGRTTIVIAHRLATVTNADWIVVLDNGRVVEEGRYETLVHAHGPFADLLTREVESAEPSPQP